MSKRFLQFHSIIFKFIQNIFKFKKRAYLQWLSKYFGISSSLQIFCFTWKIEASRQCHRQRQGRHLPALTAGHVALPQKSPLFNEGKLPPLCCSGGRWRELLGQNCGVRLWDHRILLFFVIVLLNFERHDRRLLFLLFYLGSLTALLGSTSTSFCWEWPVLVRDSDFSEVLLLWMPNPRKLD